MQTDISTSIERLVYTAYTYQWLVTPWAWWQLAVRDAPRRIDRPIFLLGVQGGGLTLLSRMLRRGGQLVSSGGSASYWTAADEMQNSHGLYLPQELSGARWKRPPHPLFTGPRSWTYAARELYAAYRRGAEQNTSSIEAKLRRVIKMSLARHAPHDSSARFIDKSQTYMLRVGLIYAALQGCDPLFILVPRDPYVSVYRAAIGKAGDMRRLARSLSYEERLGICAEHYGNSIRAVYDDVDKHDLNFHLCQFEELLDDPARVLKEVCAFAGLNFSEEMIPAAHHRIPYGSRYRDRWYPLRRDVNSAYEASIDDHIVTVVNRHCAELFDRLGYRRRHGVKDRPSVAAT